MIDETSGRKRRFFDRGPASPTVIGAGSVVTGNLRGAGPFVIAGEVHGDGDLAGALSIEATGLWKGEVRARQAIVAGKIEGGLHVEEKLEIGRTAVIRGTVSARSVAIAKGAVVDGKIEITSGAPVVQFEEKRGGQG
ncbi:MAG TPA: polymer-forming cytoskeletal protein [Steroidobacteraceae bacterium]|nr:polymer-forming cytoskeletal protein [Steroidobacteraceae bacterium]